MRGWQVMRRQVLSAAVLAFCGWFCTSCTGLSPDAELIRVGSYNIRYNGERCADRGTENDWEKRKGDVVRLIRKMDLDVFGLQEVCPDQLAYLREKLPDFVFVGEHRESDRQSGEASPVAYRRSQFEVERSGTFWLSKTPEVPGSKSWNTRCPRVCSYLILRAKSSGRRFCFANTHTDHISAEAREQGMLLIIRRMREFGLGAPIVFTGDHNCRYGDAPAVAVRKFLVDARDVTMTADSGPRNTFQGFGRYKDGPVDVHGKAYDDYRIDYIYVTPGTKVYDFVTHGDRRPGTDLYPSDHYPVTATIEL